MKSLFMVLSIAFMLFAKTTIANELVVNPVVISSFQSSFDNASNVSWTEVKGLYKAEFNYRNQFMTGFFNRDGELLAVIQNISSVNLPESLQNSIKKELTQYWISDLFRITDQDGTHYFITLKNADTQLILRSVSDKKWIVYQKGVKA